MIQERTIEIYCLITRLPCPKEFDGLQVSRNNALLEFQLDDCPSCTSHRILVPFLMVVGATAEYEAKFKML